MTPSDIVQFIGAQRASAILRTADPSIVAPAMDAAIEGGFRVIEFTLTTPDALRHVAAYREQSELVVGAGTVLTEDEARAAIDAGAQFIVSPVVDEAVISVAVNAGVCAMPGTHTPTEMLRAHQAGAMLQKLFPAPANGAKYVKAVRGPMPFLNLVPTNGVHENNVRSYLKAGAHAVGFVTPLFDPVLMQGKDWAGIRERAERLRAACGAV